VLDAVGLLVSRRMPAVVTAPTPPADWDAQLSRLLDGEQP